MPGFGRTRIRGEPISYKVSVVIANRFDVLCREWKDVHAG